MSLSLKHRVSRCQLIYRSPLQTNPDICGALQRRHHACENTPNSLTQSKKLIRLQQFKYDAARRRSVNSQPFSVYFDLAISELRISGLDLVLFAFDRAGYL